MHVSKLYSLFPFTILNLVRIHDIDKQLKEIPINNAWLMKLGFFVAKSINLIKNKSRRTEKINNNLHISKKNEFDDKIDEFMKNILENYNFIIEHNKEYLNWRYCDPRSGGFLIKQVEEGNRILGYSVLRINRYLEDYPIRFIVDLLTLPNRLDAADTLVADAIQYFDNKNVNIVNCQVVKNDQYSKILRRYGFLDSRINLHLFYTQKGMSDEINDIKTSSASKIYFSYGDIDSLPVSVQN